MAAESCAGISGFSNAEMGKGATGGTEAEMGSAWKRDATHGGAGAGVALLDELLPILLADKARIRSSGYTTNSSVFLSVTTRTMAPPSLM